MVLFVDNQGSCPPDESRRYAFLLRVGQRRVGARGLVKPILANRVEARLDRCVARAHMQQFVYVACQTQHRGENPKLVRPFGQRFLFGRVEPYQAYRVEPQRVVQQTVAHLVDVRKCDHMTQESIVHVYGLEGAL